MSRRCDDCAFTEGTVSNLYEPTKLRAELCLMNGDTFRCHHGEKPVCVGWIEARQAQGPVPEWKRELARELSNFFEAATEGGWMDVEANDEPR